MVGILRQGGYVFVKPEILLVATGAHEKTLAFPGSDLPGVYGAGAFQTVVNRDLVRPGDQLFICGGGNVGLIAAYHALQAGIDVVGVIMWVPLLSITAATCCLSITLSISFSLPPVLKCVREVINPNYLYHISLNTLRAFPPIALAMS